MTRALVIGGTSLIGRPLVETLLAGGHEVTLLHRGQGTPFGDQVAELTGDRNDPARMAEVLGSSAFDLVFDNVYDWARGTTSDAVVATARAAAHDGLHRYVFMSSVAVYPEGGPWDEDSEMVPPTDPNLYATQKAESERALFALGQETGLAVTTLRPAFVYGPHNPFDREAFFWDRLRAGRPIILPEGGSRTMQWVHSGDVARAAVEAATSEAGAGRAFNLAGPPVTQESYVQALARVAGVSAELVSVPRSELQAAGGGVMEPPLYFGTYLDIPPITVEGSRLREALGVELRPLEAGLAQTYRWYLNQERPDPDVAWEEALLASRGRG